LRAIANLAADCIKAIARKKKSLPVSSLPSTPLDEH
jgi:hypothetical protein